MAQALWKGLSEVLSGDGHVEATVKWRCRTLFQARLATEGTEEHDAMLRVAHVQVPSPAHAAGIEAGDWVLSMDGAHAAAETGVCSQQERDWTCVVVKAATVERATIVVKFRCSAKMAGLSIIPTEAVARFWLEEISLGRDNCLGWSDIDIGYHLCSLEAFEYLLPTAARETNLPTSLTTGMWGIPCCRNFALYFASGKPWIVFYGLILIEIGEIDYGEHVLEHFFSYHRFRVEPKFVDLCEVYLIKAFVLATGMLLDFHQERILEIHAEQPDPFVRKVIRGLLGSFAPESVIALDTIRSTLDLLQHVPFPKLTGSIVSCTEGLQSRLHTTRECKLSDLTVTMHPDQLLLVVWMGHLRANAGYDRFMHYVDEFAACGLFPNHIAGCVVLTSATSTPNRAWLDGESLVAENPHAQFGVFRVDEEHMFNVEQKLFDTLGSEVDDTFFVCPTIFYLNCTGNICFATNDTAQVSTVFKVIADNTRN